VKVGKTGACGGGLEDFLKRNERPATLVAQLRSFLQVPDNVLAIAQNRDLCTASTPRSSASARHKAGC
jgi:hypothetical protein